jgi:hypothetical protein
MPRRFADWDPWEYLDPDDEDLRFATYVLLKPCPFCQAHAGPPVNRFHLHTGVFQTAISCGSISRCGASMTVNGRTRNEARQTAVAYWNDRRPHAERRQS